MTVFGSQCIHENVMMNVELIQKSKGSEKVENPTVANVCCDCYCRFYRMLLLCLKESNCALPNENQKGKIRFYIQHKKDLMLYLYGSIKK